MKITLVILSLVFSAGTAVAKDSRSSVTSCSDSRLNVLFATEAAAANYCSSFSNSWVTVGVTYDYGRGAYTCSCYESGDNGGESN